MGNQQTFKFAVLATVEIDADNAAHALAKLQACDRMVAISAGGELLIFKRQSLTLNSPLPQPPLHLVKG